jgi:hypothetical protein
MMTMIMVMIMRAVIVVVVIVIVVVPVIVIVVVPVIVIVVVPVIVIPVIMMLVAVMAVIVAAGIGAANRIERRQQLVDRRAEPFQHLFDDMVAQDENAVRADRRREMPVADMPGEFGQMHHIARHDLVDLLVGCGNLDMAAVIEDETIAGGKLNRFRQIDEDAVPVGQCQHFSAQMPLVMRQRDAARQRRRPRLRTGTFDRSGAREFREVGIDIQLHGLLLIGFRPFRDG